MAIYESEKMERHIVRLLQNEGLLGKVLLMKPYLALQQVIEAEFAPQMTEKLSRTLLYSVWGYQKRLRKF